jgi:fibronectin-binding autotransporter adhesin
VVPERRVHRRRSVALFFAVLTVAAGALVAYLGMGAEASTLTVNKTSDTVDVNPGDGVCADSVGGCSLRAAIQEANAFAGSDTITLGASTYTLSLAGAEDLAATGDLDIRGNVTIDGNGAIISQTAADRVFHLPVAGFALTINDATIRGGNAGAGSGGGVLAAGGQATLRRSTLTANTATRGGGVSASGGTVTVSNSTISGNTATGTAGGGGADVTAGALNLNMATVTANANTGATPVGGIARTAGFLTASGSIVASQTSGTDCNAAFGSSSADIESGTTCGFVAGSDLQNTNPSLGPLTDNGGLTPTHRPLDGSPAIEHVNAGVAGCLPGSGLTDQRNKPRPVDADGNGIAKCDAGAVEVAGVLSLVVSSTDDQVDAVIGDGVCDTIDPGPAECTLRAAIQEANTYGPRDTITLAPGATYTLSLTGGDDTSAAGDLDIRNPVTVVGNDATIRQTAGDRTVHILANASVVSLDHVTVSGGSTFGSGGGMLVAAGTTTLADSTVTANAAGAAGGGIAVTTGSLVLQRSTISANSALTNGGGISASTPLTIVTSTISGNTAANGSGGGIASSAGITMTFSTVTANRNSAPSPVGGISNSGATATISTSIVAGQATGADCGGAGSFASGTYNVESGTSCGFTGTGDLQGVDPLLAPLYTNGGPTRTHRPQRDSPIIDRIPFGTASCGVAPHDKDQRGKQRWSGSPCESGAYDLLDPDGAPFTVNSTDDQPDVLVGDGVCDTADPGPVECTLRAAIQEANAKYGQSSVNLASDTTYTLTIAGAGEDLAVTGDLDVFARVRVEGTRSTVNAAGLDRVFHKPVVGGELILEGLIITGGSATGAGGGVNAVGTLQVHRSTIKGNASTSSGGGVSVLGGSVLLTRSTISGNTAAVSGSALYGSANITMQNDTITGNASGGPSGGAITASGGNLTIGYSTITANANTGASPVGGLMRSAGTFSVWASIIANQTSGANCGGTGFTSYGYNIESAASCGLLRPEDRTNTDPRLDVLASNGGDTQTYRPLFGSPAVDLIPQYAVSCGYGLDLDQTGAARPVDADGDLAGECDAGALELPLSTSVWTVSSTDDQDDASPGDGVCDTVDPGPTECTLRAAVREANAHFGTNTINLAPGAVYVLSLAGIEDQAATGDLDLRAGIQIAGHGATVRQSAPDRVFHIPPGANPGVSFTDLTITGGGFGSGISGGALRADGGTVAITRSTMSGNQATVLGGAIYVSGAATKVAITTSTISGNSAQAISGGGALSVSAGTVDIIRSTITQNSNPNTAPVGGIVRGASAIVTVTGSIVANQVSGADCGSLPLTSSGFNLESATTCAFTSAGDVQNTNPGLGPLQNNGGLTSTHDPIAGSPVLNAIPLDQVECTFVTGTRDQRGTARPQNEACEIGAVEMIVADLALVVNDPVDRVDVTPDTYCLNEVGGCSLRGAIQEANATLGTDTITIEDYWYLETIVLTIDGDGEDGAATGDLDIDSDLTITGTTVVDGGGLDRVFDVHGKRAVSIEGLTVRNGSTAGQLDADGGGIRSGSAYLTLTDVTLTGNHSDGAGGGLSSQNEVTFTRGIATGNSASEGGGLALADATIDGSDISSNTAGKAGGGVVSDGKTTIATSTIMDNAAGTDGGGLQARGATAISRSTIAGNDADGVGGGFDALDVSAIDQSTISGNAARDGGGLHAVADSDLSFVTITANEGGGIQADAGRTTVTSSIVADQASGPDCTPGGLSDGGYNLESAWSCDFTDTTDQQALSPKLGPLAANGWRVPTHAASPISPAYDAILTGKGGCGTTALTDERGMPRWQGAGCEKGAYEHGEGDFTFVVTTTDDTLDAVPDGVCADVAGACSLRAAVQESNLMAGSDTITFATPGLTYAPTIQSTTEDENADGDFDLLGDVTIEGDGSFIDARAEGAFDVPIAGPTVNINDLTITYGVAIRMAGGTVTVSNSTIDQAATGIIAIGGSLTIDGSSVTNSQHRGVKATGTSVTVLGSTFSANDVLYQDGSAIHTDGTLAITDSTFTANTGYPYTASTVVALGPMTMTRSTVNGGGAVGANGPTALIDRSTLTGIAYSGVYGGSSTALTIQESTISNNAGAGVRALGPTTIRNSTLSGNGDRGAYLHPASGSSSVLFTTITANATGGLDATAATSVRASIVAGQAGGLDCVAGNAATSGGYNVESASSCGFLGTGDVQNATGVLGPLGDHGGPTQTHMLIAGSAAINRMPDAATGCGDAPTTTDQRGRARPDGSSCDSGAVELRYDLPITVNSTDDQPDASPGDEVCATVDSPTECTLRAAVQEANATPGTHVITLGSGQTYTLGIAGAGEDLSATGDLDVLVGMSFVGNGSVVTGPPLGPLPPPDQFADRIFHIRSTSVPVSFTNLRISNGVTADDGGGIFHEAPNALTLSGVTVSNSTTSSTGGGIASISGSLTLTDSTIASNGARQGGGIYKNGNSSLTITHTTIADNRSSFEGGGVYVNLGTFAMSTSTVSANVAQNFSQGGGIYHRSDGAATIVSSTISGNSGYHAGGLHKRGAGAMTVASSTITDSMGGGVKVDEGTLTFTTSIVANQQFPAFYPNCEGTISSGGYNLSSTAVCGFTQATDQQSVDPLLAPLADNGGGTKTHLPADHSPAVNVIPTGTAGCGSTYVLDQRSISRPRFVACDIGAVETTTMAFGVSATADAVDVAPGNGVCDTAAAGPHNCTLRAAVQEANALAGADTIVLGSAVTYPLAIAGDNEDNALTGDLDVRAPLTVVGNGSTINAATLDRVFDVFATTFSLSTTTITNGRAINLAQTTTAIGGGLANRAGLVTLTGTTFTANQGAGGGAVVNFGGTMNVTGSTFAANLTAYGGGILSTGTLNVTSSTFMLNNSLSSGGAIWATGPTTVTSSTITGNTAVRYAGGVGSFGSLTITDSTISGNTAETGGGAVGSSGLTITRSTVSGNTASLAGGGVANGGTLTMKASTISGNSAPKGGGVFNAGALFGVAATGTITDSTITANTATIAGAGIFNDTGATITVRNSIVAAQTSGANCSGTVGSAGYNLASDTSCAFAAIGDVQGVAPWLGALANNGGPTKTHLLLAGSPAIGTGAPGCTGTDQRGVARPQGGACDKGAVEV